MDQCTRKIWTMDHICKALLSQQSTFLLSMCLNVYVCIYIYCVYVCHTCICVYLRICVRGWLSVCLYLCICVYVYMSVYLCVCDCTYVFVCVYEPSHQPLNLFLMWCFKLPWHFHSWSNGVCSRLNTLGYRLIQLDQPKETVGCQISNWASSNWKCWPVIKSVTPWYWLQKT